MMTCGCSSHWLMPNCSRMSSTFEDHELLVELLLQFALPLKGKVCRADDQDALGQSAQLQFADEQARHDGLAGAGVVSEQETTRASLSR